MNITVYLGSCEGNDPAMKKAVTQLGRWIGEGGNRLIYGGSKTGLMGRLADSVLSAGGEAVGVELEMFMEAGYQHTGLTELIVKPDFPQRKAEMIRRGDVFIAFPGGTGTLEEISEIMSLAALKLTKAPCILYNLNGYYDHLRLQLRHMLDMGLSTPERYSSTIRRFQSAYGAGCVLMSFVPGAIADLTGSYAPAYGLFAGLLAFSLAVLQSTYRLAGKQ